MALGLFLSVGFLLFALRDADLTAIVSALKRANLWFSVPLLATLAIYFWLKALRWRILLVPVCATSTRAVLPATVIGYMGNILLPAYLGELVRLQIARKKLALRGSPILATLVLERLFDFLTVLMIIGLVLVLDVRVPTELQTAGYFVATASLVFVSTVVGFTLWTESFLRLTRKWTQFLPLSVRGKLLTQLELGAQGLNVVKKPSSLLAILATSIALWVMMGVCIYFGILALDISVSVSAGFVVLALAVAGMTLPNSPGFIGTIQLAFTLGLRPYGIDASDAFAASVFFHVLANVSIVVAGAYFLKRTGESLSEIRKEAE